MTDNMRKWYFSALLLLAAVPQLSAQEDPDTRPPGSPVDIHVTVDTSQTIPTFGANRRWFVQSTYGIYTRFGPEEAGAATLGRSLLYDFGIRTKLKLWKWDALCLDVNVGQERWALKQEVGKTVPDTVLHQAARLQFNRVQGIFCNRINFNRHRGNIIGTYLDFGVYGNWMYRNLYITKDKLDQTNTSGPKEIKSRELNLRYINPLQYGFAVRFGSEFFALSATWRMSNYFREVESKTYPELPRLWLGVVIAPY